MDLNDIRKSLKHAPNCSCDLCQRVRALADEVKGALRSPPPERRDDTKE